MNVTLRQLQVFVAVAQNESYIKASRIIGLSQPAATTNIRQLEEGLGVRLLDRTTRSVRLTNEGRGFLSVAERVIADLNGAIVDIQAVGERQRGRVVVACLPSIAVRLVSPLMRAFANRHPGIVIKLYDGDARDVAYRVGFQEADFGLSGYWRSAPETEFVPLLRDRFCVVHAKGHPLERSRSIRLKDLEAYPFLALGPTTGTRQVVDEAAVKADVHLNVVCETMQISTLTGMLRHGIGVSVLPEAWVPNDRAAGLFARPLVKPSVERDLGLVLRRGRSLSPAAESFRDAIIEAIPNVWKRFTTRFY